MKNLIITTSLMIFAPTIVLAACPYNTTYKSETNTCEKSGCSGNCTVVYSIIENQENKWDAVVKPKSGVQGDIVLKEGDLRYQDKVRDLTVGEGITGLGSVSILSNGSGTLKLPSTLKTMDAIAIYNVGYQTIDVSDVKNLESSSGAYGYNAPNTVGLNGVYNLQNLIVSEDTSPIAFGTAYSSSNFPNRKVQVQCKGTDPNKCQNLITYPKLSWLSMPENFSLSPEYYKGYDENGHLLEEWGPNGCTKYSYDAGGNLQRQTDENGNVLWARRIYSVDEATKAVQKKNTFSIRYR